MPDHTRDYDVPPPPHGDPTGWSAERAVSNGWEHGTLRRAAWHGVRLFNDGQYHPAHDCFELEWYNYGSGSVESAFCHGMVQVAAGALKRENGVESGMRSLFRTAETYLTGVPDDFYGVDVSEVRERVARARRDPSAVAGWQMRIDGRRPVATERDIEYVERQE